jgi:mono/diheme cytochrome c family protein
MVPAFPVLAASLLLAFTACDSGSTGAGLHRDFNPGPAAVELHHGEVLFDSYCISCHGLFGTGQGLGPPLLDTLYLRPRLPDQAFYDAVERGVRQRHWHFGAMPPVKRLDHGSVQEIIRYVRWLQQRSVLQE